MAQNNNPPESYSEADSDDMDYVPLDKQDVIEVIEDDLPPLEGDDEDVENVDNEINWNDDDTDEELSVEQEVIPERDDAAFTFTKHTEGILCSAFHTKLNNVVATGGMDDTAYVWDSINGDILLKTKDHEDSVEVVTFSYDGKYLATCDLKGKICIWNTNDYSLARQFDIEDEFSWALWHHGSNVLISSSRGGLIYMFKVLTGQQKMIMAPFGSNCLCGKVFPDGMRLACGYSEGILKILHMKQGVVLHTIKLPDCSSAVSCLDTHRDNNLLICGCDNGDVLLIGSQGGKVVGVLNSSRASNLCNYIEAIAFCKDPTYQVAASGSLDGNLIIWDIAKQVLRHKICFSSVVNQLVWHPSEAILHITHANGIVHMYDSKSGCVLKEFMGHRKCIYSIALSADGRSLVTTSEDKTAKIYKIYAEKEN